MLDKEIYVKLISLILAKASDYENFDWKSPICNQT